MLKVKEIFGKVIRSKILKIIILIYILNAIFIVGRGYYDKMIEEKNKLENYEIRENIILEIANYKLNTKDLYVINPNIGSINIFTGHYIEYKNNLSFGVHGKNIVTENNKYTINIQKHIRIVDSYLVPFIWFSVAEGQDIIITEILTGKYKKLSYLNNKDEWINGINGYLFYN